MSFRYPINFEVAGRTVIAHLEAAVRPALNVYLIRYACCERESTIQEQSLTKVVNHNDGSPAFCPGCRRTNENQARRGVLRPRTPDSPPVFATWPAPPSSVHRP